MSLEPFLSNVPYITCVPTVSYKMVTPNDVAIVLASGSTLYPLTKVYQPDVCCIDGFWNFIKLGEVASILQESLQSGSGSAASDQSKGEDGAGSGVAKRMALKCLYNAAETCRIDPQALIDMPPGQRRRAMIDDISVVVVYL